MSKPVKTPRPRPITGAAALLASEARFQELFNAVPVAVFVCDRTAVIQNYNERAATFWGRRPKCGDPAERYCGSLKLYLPDGSPLPHAQSPIVDVLRTGQPVRNVEVLIERPDGSRLPVIVNYAALKNAQGEITGAITAFDDISQRKRSAEALRISKQRHAMLAESAPALIWAAGANGQMDYFNRHWYQYTGATLEQSAGDGWLQMLHPDDRAHTQRDWRASLLSLEPVEIEYRVRAADGGYQWFLARATSLKDEESGAIRWIGSSTNIHKQKRAEEALRQTDRRKNEFLATLAHELRNPLAPIRNAVQLMQLHGQNAEQTQWALDVIDRQTRQMARLMDDLLDVSRISRNQLEIRKQRVELVEVVRAATETSRPLIEKMGHQFTVSVPPGEIFLNADLTRLAQALSNLLNNAAKYTEPGGRIGLVVERQGGEVLLKVRDSGIGIPAPALAHIFEMFAQVDGSLERAQGGLGIGLSLAQRLITLHGGTLTAHSGGPGQGSEFTIRLPVMAELRHPVTPEALQESAAPRAATGVLKSSPAHPPQSRRILLVDDNRLAAVSLSMLLQQDGHQLRLAYDGEEAVAVAAEFRPEVVVLDIGLPKLNGYDAAKKIRQQAGGDRVLLIALTGWGQPEDRQRAHDAGFDHHLVKPVDASMLTSLLGPLDARNV